MTFTDQLGEESKNAAGTLMIREFSPPNPSAGAGPSTFTPLEKSFLTGFTNF